VVVEGALADLNLNERRSAKTIYYYNWGKRGRKRPSHSECIQRGVGSPAVALPKKAEPSGRRPLIREDRIGPFKIPY